MTDIIVNTEQGLLRGKKSVNYKNRLFYSFHGIPYALPPLGKLRFKAPEPPASWEGVKDATKERDGCISRNTYTGKVEGGEDCLFLNVYTPKLASKGTNSLPVLVWVHGGAFQSGSTKTELYGPDYLLTEDIVLVTVNYRLGALGFLCLEDTTLDVTGNNSLRDIIFALKWVQRNIEAFSGDPNNVTLFGESSGAVSIHYLMLSPLAKGLFHKIILQSGCTLHHWARGRRDYGKKLAEVLGLSTHSEKEILEFLQSQPVDMLFKAQEQLKVIISPHVERHFYPVIEKKTQKLPPVICEDPISLILKGDYHKVPMMIGYTSCEGMFFEFLIKMRTKNNIDNTIIKNVEDLIPHHLNIPRKSPLSKYIANELRSFYFNDEEPKLRHRKQFYEAQSDANFNYLLYKTALMHLEKLGKSIYFYRFSFDGKFNIYKQLNKIHFPGAAHCDDVCYLFKLSPVKEIIEDSPEEITIRRMVKLWTNFAKYGDPNDGHSKKLIPVTWKPIKAEEFHFLDIGNDLSLHINPEKDRYKLWKKIYELHPLLGKL